MTVPLAQHVADAEQNGRVDNPLRCLSLPEIRALPPVAWLIENVLVALAFLVLYGASGVGKSFLALDWALTVASGLPWCGHETRGGWVLYIAAEGAAGLSKRVDAWCAERGVPEPERILFIPDAPNLLDPISVAHVIERIDAMPEPPVLIVIDTAARTMVGGDENSARDMGQYVANVDQVRRAAGGCATLTLHHTGKRGDEERGSSALRGAWDEGLALSGEIEGTLTLAFDKVKDFEEGPPLYLHMPAVHGSRVPRLGGSSGDALTANERRVLERLSELDGSDEPSNTRLAAICQIPERTFHRVLKDLRAKGFTTAERHGKATWNHLTDSGREALLP
jgi:AAA domain